MVQALNRIAYCFGRDVAPRYDLPDLMVKEDAGELWGRVFELVRIMAPGSTAQIEQLTQEVFLWLLSTRVFESFIGEGLSDEEMIARLLAIVTAAEC